ncbi:MAG: fluoroquinolone resistance protein [Microvirga sp.]|jgi:uncharacterized protein YjbI with pentapeptide repeats|nr:fluoroquinolone resistance protein [Microvirga sp.]
MAGQADNEGRTGLPATSSAKGGQEQITDKGDLTNLSFAGLNLRGLSARQAFFSGTLFRDCTFQDCDFSRSDFEGAVFENCTMYACNLSIADFRSVEFARSRFTKCNFSEGGVKYCTFHDCVLDQCEWFQQGFEGNRLTDCELVDCNFHRSTMLHDEFSTTRFVRTDLADCTSLYHLFSGCEFVESSINAEAVGLTFGLTGDNLRGLDLTWLGDRLQTRDGGADLLIQDLITTYRARDWYFAAAMVELNFGIVPRLEALAEIFRALDVAATSPRPLKTGEIRFLTRVMEILSDKRQLPLLAVVAGLEMITRNSEPRNGRDEFELRPLYHTLADAEQKAFLELDRCWEALARLPPEQPVRVRFVLSEKPDVDIGECLAELHEWRALPHPAPRFLENSRGSYIEVFLMLPVVLASFVVALSMVERIVDRMISIRARFEVLLGGKLPLPIRRLALQPFPGNAAAIAKEIGGYMDVFRSARGGRLADGARRIAEKLEGVEIEG